MRKVSARIRFRAVDAAGVADATLWYDRAEPFQVRIEFSANKVWEVARTVVRDGLVGQSGIGDFTCWTDPDDYFHIQLTGSRPDEPPSMILRCPADPIRGFLIDTEDVVPYGNERINFDAELAALLGGAR